MSTSTAPTTVHRPLLEPPPLSLVPVLGWSVVAGVLLGVVDVGWNLHDPSAWSVVANTEAGWATAAFVATAILRTTALRSAFAGVVMLCVAVESYYAAASIWHAGSLRILTSHTAAVWLVSAVAAGIVFGLLGSLTHHRSWGVSAVGYAAGAALCLGSAVYYLRSGSAGSIHDQAVALGAIGLAVLAPTLARPRVALLAAAISIPLVLGVTHVYGAIQYPL